MPLAVVCYCSSNCLLDLPSWRGLFVGVPINLLSLLKFISVRLTARNLHAYTMTPINEDVFLYNTLRMKAEKTNHYAVLDDVTYAAFIILCSFARNG